MEGCQPPYTPYMPITRLMYGIYSQQCALGQCGDAL